MIPMKREISSLKETEEEKLETIKIEPIKSDST